MSIRAQDPSSALFSAVAATHNEFNAAMTPESTWILTSNVGCWYKQGAHAALGASGATAGAGSVYLAAGVAQPIDGKAGADLSVIADSTTGKASLARGLIK